MKRYWRVCSVAVLYLAFSGVVRGQEFAPTQPVGEGGYATWLTQQPQKMPATSEFQLLSGATEINAEAVDGPVQAPVGEVGHCDADCVPLWAHRSGVFGELMFLRARNAEVAYAVPIDGAIVPPPNPPIQAGPIAVADPDFSPGFRIGGVYAMDDCSSLALTYTRFQSSSTDAVATTAPLVLRSLVLHPGTANAGSDFLSATAFLDVKFDLLDADYRAVWAAGDLWVVNYVVGARYANIRQDFTGIYTGTGTTDSLITNVNFDGGGIKLGLDGTRFACNSGFLVYGRANASFLAGEFRTRYTQGSDVDPVIVNTTWKAGRIVSILDLELGAGWQSPCGHWRLTAGYMVSAWYNTIRTNNWIQAVQQNNFVTVNDPMHDTITFDGFTTRLDYRW